jgi:SNF2 family DNA or RNA helicase
VVGLFDEVSDLEARRREHTARADEKRGEIARLLGQLEDEEKAEQRSRKDIAEIRRREEAEQRRQESRAQANQVRSDVSRLEEKYRRIAEGRVWYDGSDDVGSILPFQWRGALFGAGAKRWILGDGMGLGKTRQSIGWLDLVEARKVLIVCQADICDQFAGEVMTLAPHRNVTNLYKKAPKTRHALMEKVLASDAGVVVVNFEIWRKDKDLLAKLMSWQIDTMIVDEAHNLKNTSTSNFKYVEMLVKVDNVCPKCKGGLKGLHDADKKLKPCQSCGWRKGDLTPVRYAYKLDEWLSSKSMKNVCFTTGTPILNSPMDIYALLHLCDPMLFARKSQFLQSFCIQNHHSGKIEFRDGQLDNLKPLIAGRFLARTRDEAGIVLPVQRKHIVRVDMDRELYKKQYKIVRQLSERAQIMLDSGESMTIMHLIALITRKRQANVWPAGIELKDSEGNVVFSVGEEVRESCKIDVALDQILQIHNEGRRQVVFSQFTTALQGFKDVLEEAGLRVALLTGATPRKLRDEIKNNFYLAKGEEPKWDIVLCNYKTGGTGLNLTAATATHIIDEEWNPGKRDQAYARTDRIGQELENDVYIYRIPASIDTWMSNTIHRKEQMVSAFQDTMGDEDAEMTAESLSEAMRTGAIL